METMIPNMDKVFLSFNPMFLDPGKGFDIY